MILPIFSMELVSGFVAHDTFVCNVAVCFIENFIFNKVNSSEDVVSLKSFFCSPSRLSKMSMVAGLDDQLSISFEVEKPIGESRRQIQQTNRTLVIHQKIYMCKINIR
jgi:hypothetical protein